MKPILKIRKENLDLGLPKQDLTIFIDIPITESVVRKTKNRDRYERNKKFLKNVKSKYNNLASKNKWFKINGDRSKDEVSNEIWRIVEKKYRIKK